MPDETLKTKLCRLEWEVRGLRRDNKKLRPEIGDWKGRLERMRCWLKESIAGRELLGAS